MHYEIKVHYVLCIMRFQYYVLCIMRLQYIMCCVLWDYSMMCCVLWDCSTLCVVHHKMTVHFVLCVVRWQYSYIMCCVLWDWSTLCSQTVLHSNIKKIIFAHCDCFITFYDARHFWIEFVNFKNKYIVKPSAQIYRKLCLYILKSTLTR